MTHPAAWSTCSRDHRHLEHRPSVLALAVDARGRVLLVPFDEVGRPDSIEPRSWTVPIAAVRGAHRTSTLAAESVAAVLQISTAGVQVLPGQEEACEDNGLRLHVVLLVDHSELPARVDDGPRSHWWATRAEVEDTTLEPILADLFDRDDVTAVWS